MALSSHRALVPLAALLALALALALAATSGDATRVQLRDRLSALRSGSPASASASVSSSPEQLQLDEAYDVAVAHLNDFSRLAPQWVGAKVDKARAVAVHRPDLSDKAAYLEFPVVGADGSADPRGFILVSTGVHDFPVPHFNTEGLTLTQRLLRDLRLDSDAAGSQPHKFFAVDALSFVVQDRDGRFLGATGPLASGFPLAKPTRAADQKPVLHDSDSSDRHDATALLEEQESHGASTVSADSHWLSWEHLRDEYETFFGPQIAALETEARTWWKSGMDESGSSATTPVNAAAAAADDDDDDGSSDNLSPQQELQLPNQLSLANVPSLDIESVRSVDSGAVLKLQFDSSRMISLQGLKSEVPVDLDTPDFEREAARWDAKPANALDDPEDVDGPRDDANLHDEPTQDVSGVETPAASAVPLAATTTVLRAASTQNLAVSLAELDAINDSGSGKPASQIGTLEGEVAVRGSTPLDRPDYTQFDYKGCKVGCGAIATAMLYGWADLQDQGGDSMFRRFSPILRASGTSKGAALTVAAPQTMTESVKEMARELRDDMGTWCVPFGGGNAATNPWRLGDAHNYFVRYKKPFALHTMYHSLGFTEAPIRDRAIFNVAYLRNPVVIGVGWLYHYPLAKKYAVFKTSSGRRGYFWAEYGWSGSTGNGYIPASIWAAGYINSDSWWANRFDQPLDFRCPSGQALHSMLSYHSNKHEDRRWSFQCRPVQFNNAQVALHSCYTTSYVNNWDGTFSFISNPQEIVVGAASEHSNHHEDRRWRFHVCKLSNVALNSGCFDSAPNEFDQPLSVQCGSNRFVRGVSSYHSNQHEDRRFTIRCCGLTSTLPTSLWSGHVNQFDQPVQYTCPSGMALGGLSSYHSNHHEDRRWSFFCIRPSSPLKAVVSTGCTWTDYVNNYDAVINYIVPAGRVLTGAYSVHSNHHEDRRWKLQHCSMTQLTGVCYWTDYVNAMDQPLTFTCPSAHALRGVYSYHSNHHEDRRWRLYCCKYA